jgi:hypothetical protein
MSDLGLASVLLADAPIGEYLIEQVGDQRRLWRLSEGEPPDGALEPAEAWRLDREVVEARPAPPAPLESKSRNVWRWCRRRAPAKDAASGVTPGLQATARKIVALLRRQAHAFAHA